MKSLFAISLLFVTLLVSVSVYAATDQPNLPSGKFYQSYGVSPSNPPAVFAGPKVGWVKVPVEEGTPSLLQTVR